VFDGRDRVGVVDTLGWGHDFGVVVSVVVRKDLKEECEVVGAGTTTAVPVMALAKHWPPSLSCTTTDLPFSCRAGTETKRARSSIQLESAKDRFHQLRDWRSSFISHSNSHSSNTAFAAIPDSTPFRTVKGHRPCVECFRPGTADASHATTVNSYALIGRISEFQWSRPIFPSNRSISHQQVPLSPAGILYILTEVIILAISSDPRL